MLAIIKRENKKIAETNFPRIPQVGNRVRLRNYEEYTIKSITFVESHDTTEIDYISHIELDVE